MTTFVIGDTARIRIREVQAKPQNEGKFLRVSISSGGCSGFQYIFELDDKIADGDIKLAEENGTLLAVSDESSMEFLKDAQLDFVKELGASYFKVTNPNSSANCGCGASFSV